MSIVVYGIPNCGTVQKARAWLEQTGRPHAFHDFRKELLPAEQIAGWVDVLGSAALRNTSGGSYRALPAEKADWSEAQWAEAMAADPMLIKRPVVEKDGVAVSAGFRKPEALAALLG